MNVWRLITHHEYPKAVVEWSRASGRIAIGWGNVGNLGQYHSPHDISSTIERIYPKATNASMGGPSLWCFYHDLNIGDLVILSTGQGRELVMRVAGGYEFVSPSQSPLFQTYGAKGDYLNQRKALVTQIDPDELWYRAGGKQAKGENLRWTLARCLKTVDTM